VRERGVVEGWWWGGGVVVVVVGVKGWERDEGGEECK
jgi:hypothetical protein